MSAEYFEAKDYVHAVNRSFKEDSNLVVVKNMIHPERAEEIAKLTPEKGKSRIYMQPRVMIGLYDAIPTIASSRGEIKEVLGEVFGKSILRNLWLQLPDMMRAHDVGTHVDNGGILFSTAINLREGAVFFGSRVAESKASKPEIADNFRIWEEQGGEFASVEDLGVGDAAVIARGVAHATNASESRRAITYRSRGHA